MTPLRARLAELKALAAKATKGPWVELSGDDEYCSSVYGVISKAEEERIRVDTRQHRGDFPEDTRWIVVDAGCAPVTLAEGENFAFIAAAREAVPDLVRRLEAALDVVDAAREEDDARRCGARLSDSLAAFDALDGR